jgi:hypothetical protein
MADEWDERDRQGQFTVIEERKKKGTDVYTVTPDEDDLGDYGGFKKKGYAKGDTNFVELYKDLVKYKVISNDGHHLHPEIISDTDLRRFLAKDGHTKSNQIYVGIRDVAEYQRDAKIREYQVTKAREGVKAFAPETMAVPKAKKVRVSKPRRKKAEWKEARKMKGVSIHAVRMKIYGEFKKVRTGTVMQGYNRKLGRREYGRVVTVKISGRYVKQLRSTGTGRMLSYSTGGKGGSGKEMYRG